MGLMKSAARATTACVGLMLLCPAAAVAAPTPADADCAAWQRSTVASGYGMLEGLAFDGRGGLLLSNQALAGAGGTIQRLAADGTRSTMAAADGVGKIVVSGRTAYFTTGDSIPAGIEGRADGTIRAVDLTSGTVSTIAGDLVVPNGIVRLPDGDFVVSSDQGPDTRLTKVAENGSPAGPYTTALTSTNGLAYDPARRRLYVSTTFNPTTVIAVIDVDRPAAAPTLIPLPGYGPLNAADGIALGPDGAVYVTESVGGRVVRLDPDTGRSCVIADNLLVATAAAFGSGPGWDPHALYITSYLGTITKLTPNVGGRP